MPGFHEYEKHDICFNMPARQSIFDVTIQERAKQWKLSKQVNRDTQLIMTALQQCRSGGRPLCLRMCNDNSDVSKYGLIRLTDDVDTFLLDKQNISTLMNTYTIDGAISYSPCNLRIKGYVYVWYYSMGLTKYKDLGSSVDEDKKMIKRIVNQYGTECKFDELTVVRDVLARGFVKM